MDNYRIIFQLDDELVELPVLPEKITVKGSLQGNEKTVLELGNVNLLKSEKLKTISFNSFFPTAKMPSVTARKLFEPLWYVKKIKGLMKDKKPFRFVMIGNDLDINTQMTVDSFEYSESYGAVGDLDYKLTLKEWVDYSPRKVTIRQETATSAPVAVTESKTSSGTPPSAPKDDKSATYTVKRGDCLWSICQQIYGNGNLYAKFYEANKAVIDAKNKGTGNPKYTIYVGTVLTLPPKEKL